MFSLLEILVLLASVHQAVAGPLIPRYMNNTVPHESSSTALFKAVSSGSSSSTGIGSTSEIYSTQTTSLTFSVGATSNNAFEAVANTYSPYSAPGNTGVHTTASAQNLVSMQDGEPAYGGATLIASGQSTGTTTLTLTTTVPPSHGANATAYSSGSSHNRPAPEESSNFYSLTTTTRSLAPASSASETIGTSSSEKSVDYSTMTEVTHTAFPSKVTSGSESSNRATAIPAHPTSGVDRSSETTISADITTTTSPTKHTTSSSEDAHLDATTQAAESPTKAKSDSSAVTTSYGFTYPSHGNSSPTTSVAQPTTYGSDSSGSSRTSSQGSSSSSIANPVQTGQQGSVSASPDGSSDSNESASSDSPSESQPTSTASDLPPVITGDSSSESHDSTSSAVGPGITIVPIDPNMTTVTKTVTNPGWTVTMARETVTVTSYR